jgi:hypothetical protein
MSTPAAMAASPGFGRPAIPVTVRAIRRLETRVRRLSGDWCPWLLRRYGALARSLLAPAQNTQPQNN